MKRRLKIQSVVREIVFGVEDSLVSTLGALTGIAAGTQSTYVVVLAGIVLIFAEALSMAAGSYLSSKVEGEMWLREHEVNWDALMKKKEHMRPLQSVLRRQRIVKGDQEEILGAVEVLRSRWLRLIVRHERSHSPSGSEQPIVAGVVMGVSYFAAGFIPLGSYLLLPVKLAIAPSLIVTTVALFAFGAWQASFTGRSRLKSGLEMTIVAMSAAGIAFVLGQLARSLFGVAVS